MLLLLLLFRIPDETSTERRYPMLSKHLISYTNNKTRIIKTTKAKASAYSIRTANAVRSSIRTLSYGFFSVVLFRARCFCHFFSRVKQHEKVRERRKKNANLALRLPIRITTENPRPAWDHFYHRNRRRFGAVLRSRVELPMLRRLLFNSIFITVHPSQWCVNVSSFVYCFD